MDVAARVSAVSVDVPWGGPWSGSSPIVSMLKIRAAMRDHRLLLNRAVVFAVASANDGFDFSTSGLQCRLKLSRMRS